MKDYGWYTAKCWPELLVSDFKFWAKMVWRYKIKRVIKKIKKFLTQEGVF